MFSRLSFRNIVLILALVCVLIRLTYVLAKEQVPVMWDARLYASAALGLIYYAGHGGTFGHPERDSTAETAFQKVQFENTMGKYIKGEQINWLYYSQPSTAEAQEYLFTTGLLYPLYLALIFLLSFLGSDFTVIRIINALLDGVMAAVVMMIARELFDRRTAIVSGIIYALYLPFILLTGLVLTEQVTSLIILLALYAVIQWYKTDKAGNLYIFGGLLGLLVWAKSTAALLFVPFILGFLYDSRSRLGGLFKPLGRIFIPFALVAAPWIIITSLYFDKPAFRDPRFSEANFRSSSSVKYQGYDLDQAEPDFWTYSVPYTISRDPVGYAKLLVTKFERLWGQPYNDFHQSFILTPGAGRIVHVLIIVTGIFGVFYFVVDRKSGLIYLLTIPLYYGLLHSVFHSVSRYNLNAMPLLVIASSAVIIKVYDYLKGVFQRGGLARHILQLSLIILGFAVVALLSMSLAASSTGGSSGMETLIIAKIVVLAVLMILLIRVLTSKVGFARSLLFGGLPTVILAVVMTTVQCSPDSWAEWSCPLERPGQTAGIRIYIPNDIKLGPDDAVGIALDLKGSRNDNNRFVISVNGQKAVLNAGRPPLSDSYYKKAAYPVFETMLAISREEMRYWSVIPISSAAFNEMARAGMAEIWLSPADSSGSPSRGVILFGNYTFHISKKAVIPDLNHSSVERLWEKGDPRPWVEYPLLSDSVISYYIDNVNNRNAVTNDLSAEWGRQSGRYRIYIEVRRPDDTKLYF